MVKKKNNYPLRNYTDSGLDQSLPKTIFLDIDGCIFMFKEELAWKLATMKVVQTTPGAASKIFSWHAAGHQIILTTARPESMRTITITQLENANILYDQLIMGVSTGARIVINDFDNNIETKTAIYKAAAFNLIRNEGLNGITL
jgi:hypothetical protein